MAVVFGRGYGNDLVGGEPFFGGVSLVIRRVIAAVWTRSWPGKGRAPGTGHDSVGHVS